jgi:hypothetical protein
MAQKSPLLRRFAVFSRNTKEISGDMSYPRISFYTLIFFRLKTCISLSECTLMEASFCITKIRHGSGVFAAQKSGVFRLRFML